MNKEVDDLSKSFLSACVNSNFCEWPFSPYNKAQTYMHNKIVKRKKKKVVKCTMFTGSSRAVPHLSTIPMKNRSITKNAL